MKDEGRVPPTTLFSSPLPSSFLPMRLYLLRHADAEDVITTDAERRLTDLGRAQAERVGRFCQRHAIRPDHLLTSPFRRAVETVDAVARALETTWSIEPFLASGMDPETALTELHAYARAGSVLLVGHQPDLGQLAAVLLGLAHDGNFPVATASLSALEARPLVPGGGALRFCLPPELMG